MIKNNLDYIIYNAVRQIPIALAALCALLTVGCSETLDALSPTQTVDTEVTFAVAEQPWDGQSVELMRSSETLSELQDSTYAGFGLYSDSLSMANLQVKWDVKKGKWVYGDKMLWPKNKVDTTLTNIYAYAPYTKDNTWNEEDKSITIECDKINTTDWLWAKPKVDSLGIIHLDFRHALAQLSFGSITNTYGSTIRLMSVSVSGKFYTKGNLSLAKSTWTDKQQESTNREYSKKYETIIETKEGDTTTETVEGIEIENGDAVLFDFTDVIMQIPGVEVKIEFVIKTKYGQEIITKDVTLEQGVNKEINLTVKQNHEVVIK